jgi:hypothetical protein
MEIDIEEYIRGLNLRNSFRVVSHIQRIKKIDDQLVVMKAPATRVLLETERIDVLKRMKSDQAVVENAFKSVESLIQSLPLLEESAKFNLSTEPLDHASSFGLFEAISTGKHNMYDDWILSPTETGFVISTFQNPFKHTSKVLCIVQLTEYSYWVMTMNSWHRLGNRHPLQ